MDKLTQPTLLVLAAGMGSRYGGLKQIDPVGPGGETIIDYSIYDALRAGFGRIVFVIRRDIEQAFKETLGVRFEKHFTVEYVVQELGKLPGGFEPPPDREKPWGTGHAILIAAEVIHEPFAVINGDDFYGANSFRILAEHLGADTADYAMVGFVLRNTLSEHGAVARGKCKVDANGLLENVTEIVGIEPVDDGAQYADAKGELHRLTGQEMVSMNMWGFTPSLFAHLRRQMTQFLEQHGRDPGAEFFIPTVVNTLISSGQERVRVLRTPNSWFGVTYREDRPRVIKNIRQLVSRGDYPERLWG